ncbi:MAG TPA: type II secretion system protein N [Solimonas sp.]|nr:type II secretion system protein N [Solimonas sp.]
MRQRWLIALGLAVFVLGLLAAAPIATLYAWVRPKEPPPQTLLMGLQGTLHEGRIAGVVSNNRTVLTDLHWRLHPLWLLGGRFAAHIDGGGSDVQLDGGVSVTPAGTVRFRDLRANAGLKALLGAFGYPFLPLDGKAALNLQRLTLKDGVPQAATGNGMIQNLAYTLSRDPIVFGDFQIDLSTEGDAVLAKLASIAGPLEVNGEARVQDDGAYESLIKIKPKPEANPMLRNLVGSLGAPDLQGWYTLKRAGQLHPKPPVAPAKGAPPKP